MHWYGVTGSSASYVFQSAFQILFCLSGVYRERLGNLSKNLCMSASFFVWLRYAVTATGTDW